MEFSLVCTFPTSCQLKPPGWSLHIYTYPPQVYAPCVVDVQSLSYVWLCSSMNCSSPGFPVLHYLPKFAQTHVHWVGDAIQPSYPLLPPSFALSLSQHQGIFQWADSLHQLPIVLELHLQHQSFQWIFRIGWFPLKLTDYISLLSKGLSRVFSNTTVQKHQLFGALPIRFISHNCT